MVWGALLGAAVGHFTQNYRNRRARQDTVGSIEDRIRLGQKYGIHPLAMIGASGNTFGGGGYNPGMAVGDAVNTAISKRERKKQDARAKELGFEDYAHMRGNIEKQTDAEIQKQIITHQTDQQMRLRDMSQSNLMTDINQKLNNYFNSIKLPLPSYHLDPKVSPPYDPRSVRARSIPERTYYVNPDNIEIIE